MKNKKIIITGGASGIGKSICEAYAKLGWTILIMDINLEAGLDLKNKLSKITTVYFYPCDFSQSISVTKATSLIKSEHEILDSIIHNARAPNKSLNIADNLDSELERDFNIFIRSPLLLSELLIKNLSNGEDPSITFIGSTNSSFISHQPLSYHLCKGALLQLVRYLAVQWGPLNIRVNLVNPGIVDVPDRPRRNTKLFTKVINAVIPLGRTALASEVASACIFLSSKESKYITGTTINLDGGEHLKDHFSLAYNIFNSKEE